MKQHLCQFSVKPISVVLVFASFAALVPLNSASAGSVINVPVDRPTIQAAMDTAVNGDVVLVAPGTYFENLNFRGKAIEVRSAQGPLVTIVDGNLAGPVVTFASREGPTSVLRGFTLQRGRDFDGGGVLIGSSPSVLGNIISNNVACFGGGIAILFSSPIVRGNVVTNNTPMCSGGFGGGIHVGGAGNAQVLENVISNNRADSGGGISLFAAGTPTIRGNVISGNNGGSQGGGIWIVNQSDASVSQNLITRNMAAQGGGLYWLVPSSARGPVLVNNTFADNDGLGSGIFADGFDAQTALTNNIIIGKSGQTAAIYCGDFNDRNPPVFRFNDIFSPTGPAYGGACSDQTGLNGNISVDPLFVNPASADYHMRSGSAGIDAGDNSAPQLPTTDLDGRVRITDGNGDGRAVVDLGVYELPPLAGSLSLGGVGSFAETPHASDLNITANWTVEAWFKDEDASGFNHEFRQIITKGDSTNLVDIPYFVLVGNGNIIAGTRAGGQDYRIIWPLTGLQPKAWHHVAVRFNASLGVLNLWLDGQNVTYASVPVHGNQGNTLPVDIGRNGASSGKYWLGRLDDVRIWNVARTAADVTANFVSELAGPQPGLVANWKFNEGSGATAADSAGGHTATLYGSAHFSTDVHGAVPPTATPT